MTRPLLGAITGSLLLGLGLAATVGAQSMRVVRLRVTDTTGLPLRGVTVTLVDVDGRALATARTDSSGTQTLQVPAEDRRAQLVAQRIGYIATRRLLSGAMSADTVALSLAPLASSLDTVRVDETAAVRTTGRSSIGDDEIAATTKGVFDFFDVLKKLRPDLNDRIGRDIQYKCLPNRHAGSVLVFINEARVPAGPMFVSALREVKSDAIEDLRYVSCFDKSLAGDDYSMIGHIYVTLKKGYAFNIKRGTFKEDPRPRTETSLPDVAHPRVVGVYDAVTGVPIEGAEVTNLLNSYSALTTRTGSVALSYVDTMGALMRIARTGYAPLVMPMSNRPDDLPLTLTLTPRGSAQPRLARRAGPADTVRKLVMVGFYDRRDTLSAATRVALDGDEIRKLQSLSDAPAVMGRPLCATNLFIDGARLALRGRIDDLLGPTMIAGIETYIDAEVPPDMRLPSSRCATLVWTN